MAGHNRWVQIKRKKAKDDSAKSRIFSKFANNISIAAKQDPNPEFNPTLRSAVERARAEGMPQENIERAIKRAKENANLEEMLLEIYGPEGSGMLVETVTDNTNRTVNEIKALIKDYEAKLGTPGSLAWSFEKTENGYASKFPQAVSETAREKIQELIDALGDRDDIKEIYTNCL